MEEHLIAIAKKGAAEKAATFIEEGMQVGLGTGSTAAYFIEALGNRVRQGLKITAVATSQETMRQAQKLNIPLLDPDSITSLDITVDGADEIDPSNAMIKGGGGALLREKLLAHSSRKMIVIVDETKLVDHLGAHPLPIEIAPFAYQTTLKRLEEKGYRGKFRLTHEKQLFVTDNGNYIMDLQLSTPILNAPLLEQDLKKIAGVLETGLFYNLAGNVMIGYEDGLVRIKPMSS